METQTNIVIYFDCLYVVLVTAIIITWNARFTIC